MKKLSNTEAGLKEALLIKKSVFKTLRYFKINLFILV